MRNQKKEKKRKIPMPVIVFSAVLVSFMLSFFLGQSGILRLRQLQEDYEKLRMENYKLSLENRETREEIQKLKRDPATVEKIAREDLHMAAPNDLVLLVPSDESEKTRSIRK